MVERVSSFIALQILTLSDREEAAVGKSTSCSRESDNPGMEIGTKNSFIRQIGGNLNIAHFYCLTTLFPESGFLKDKVFGHADSETHSYYGYDIDQTRDITRPFGNVNGQSCDNNIAFISISRDFCTKYKSRGPQKRTKTTADASTSTSTEVRIYNTDGKLIKQEIPHILPKVITCNKKGKSVKSTIMQLVLTIGQHYYLGLSLMGSGGFGKVYMGYDVIEKRCVAIKVVNMEVAELDDEEIETMKKEPIIQQRFAGNPHSHVVQLYNHKIDDEKKTFYMVMELASGSFDKLLETVKEKDRAAIIVRAWNQMLPAVKEIHEKGIMHMDLKPENFLVFHHPDAKEPTDFDLKMSDFGIAMDLPANKVVHTQLSFKDVRIASPEQVVCADDLENSNRHWLWGYKPLSWLKQDDSIDKVPSFLHKITPKVDIWGLGMCLHIMMYGSGPYAVHIPADAHTLMTQPGFHIVPMAYKDNPKLYNIVKSCLQIDADARPTIQKLLSEEYKVTPKVKTPKNEKSAENSTKNDKN